MKRQGSGVILAFGGYGDPLPNYGGFQLAFGAVEAMRRNVAVFAASDWARTLTATKLNMTGGTVPD